MNDPRFPIGSHDPGTEVDPAEYPALIAVIERTPSDMRAAVGGLTDDQLDTPYREGGWTLRQVLHHVPDSHMNAFIRMKLALTEDNPVIKPYEEARWAELGDVASTPVEVSLSLLESLHTRWVALLRSMRPADFDRTYIHPEHGRSFRLGNVLAMYAWHCRHHVAHITTLRQQKGW